MANTKQKLNNNECAFGGWMLTLRRDSDRIGYHLYMHNYNVSCFFPGGWVTENPGWQHLALVYDPGRGALGAWELFINGVSAGVLANTQAPNTHGIAAFNLGGRAFSAANTFRGLFDYWRVSSGARSPSTFLCVPPDPGTQLRVLMRQSGLSQRKDTRG